MKYGRLFLLIVGLFYNFTSKAETVCYIGDSQSASSGAMFSLLKPTLAASATIGETRAVCGATAADYISGGVKSRCHYKGITSLQGRGEFHTEAGQSAQAKSLCQNADTAIIELGDNYLGNPEAAATDAIKLTAALGNKKCIWIGPAAARSAADVCALQDRQKHEVATALQKALAGKCTFINSYDLTKSDPPKSSTAQMCIHYFGDYGKWANAIKGSLAQALSSPNTVNRDESQESGAAQ